MRAVLCSLALAAVLGVAATTAAVPPLPSGFVGHWHAVPDATVFGPLNALFNFSIVTVDDTNTSSWLMSDQFTNYLGRNSKQEFWVHSESDEEGDLTYCGDLLSFYKGIQGGAYVQVTFTQVERTDTRMAWAMNASHHVPWTGHWSLELLDGGRKLKSEYMMPADIATHFSATYDRVDDSDMPLSVPRPKHMPANGDSICRYPVPPRAMSSSHRRDVQRAALLHANENRRFGGANDAGFDATPAAGERRCPLGFGSAAGTAPGDMEQRVRSARAVTDAREASRAVGMDMPDQFCYLINPQLNFSMHWNWNTSTQSVDVVMTTTAPAVPENHYIAMGIYPDWPGMQKMDIVLGYLTADAATGAPTGCVRSLYAKEYVGTPVDAADNQTITNTRVWTAGGLMHVGFTRPWATGHHNLAEAPPSYGNGMPVISYATGRVSPNTTATCGGELHYHGNNRGTYGFMFYPIEQVLPDYMKCSNNGI